MLLFFNHCLPQYNVCSDAGSSGPCLWGLARLPLSVCSFRKQKQEFLPEEVQQALHKGLRDGVYKVRFYAAISMSTMSVPNEAASAIIYDALENGSPDMRWRSARSLASLNVCTVVVVEELLTYLTVVGSDMSRRTEAIRLLMFLSESSNIVRALAGELLNSCNSKRRLAAVKLLPRLSGHTGKDAADKLLAMMWADWSIEIKQACLLTLGLTGNATVVHEDLIDKLRSPKTNTRVEALAVMAKMVQSSPRLLPGVIACLNDEYVATRVAACDTYGNFGNFMFVWTGLDRFPADLPCTTHALHHACPAPPSRTAGRTLFSRPCSFGETGRRGGGR